MWVKGACGGCVGGHVRCVWGVSDVGVGAMGQRTYRSPLYYPDTLVNPDTCLGLYDMYVVSVK